MVGVAGKSKACQDCKRRRVKCDFTKPACLRCDKAGIACRGYEKEPPIFVNRTPAAPSTTALSAIVDSTPRQRSSIPSVPALDWSLALQRLKIELSNQACPLTEFRTHAWALLKELYLPQAHLLDGTDTLVSPAYSWLRAVCEMRGRSEALDHSLLAFCAIQVNIVETDGASVDEGLQMYNYALQELVKDLKNGVVRNNDETLAAIVVLSTCELFVAPNDQAWRAHTHGISELLRQRNQSNFTSHVWQSLCSRLRIICVLQGLSERRALALGADRWRTLMSVESKAESFQGLIDLISDLPLLLEETETVYANSKSGVSGGEPYLYQALLCMLQKLDYWQQVCRRNSTKAAFWAVPSRMHNPSDDKFANNLFPFALEYESLDTAMAFILSSGVMLQILATILRLDAACGFFDQLNLPLSTTDASVLVDKYTSISSIRAEADRVARFICQSIEYCHRRSMGTIGPQSTCYVQWMTRLYFSQVGLARELDWSKNIKNLSGPDCRCGIKLMLFGQEEEGKGE